MLSPVRATLSSLQTTGNIGIVPPYILEKLPKNAEPGNGGIVPPHLQPKPPQNGGIVPPHLQPKPPQNGGVVPPHLEPRNGGVVPQGDGVPGNTGIVPPYLLDQIEEQAKSQGPRTPVLQPPAAGHVPTRQDPFSTSEIAPGSFGRCPPASAEEAALTPAGRAAIDAWFTQTVARLNASSAQGGFAAEYVPEQQAWRFVAGGSETFYAFDGDNLKVLGLEGRRVIPVAHPLTPQALVDALQQAA